jgi:hypothetical protein
VASGQLTRFTFWQAKKKDRHGHFLYAYLRSFTAVEVSPPADKSAFHPALQARIAGLSGHHPWAHPRLATPSKQPMQLLLLFYTTVSVFS